MKFSHPVNKIYTSPEPNTTIYLEKVEQHPYYLDLISVLVQFRLQDEVHTTKYFPWEYLHHNYVQLSDIDCSIKHQDTRAQNDHGR